MTKITFYGGAQTVTGACYHFDSGRTKILVDCGLFQCPRVCEPQNYEKFLFDPKEIEAVFITHAHIDHTGRIPKLFKDGFKGKVYSTPPTKDLARLMLEDSLGVMEKEARGEKKELLFGLEDIEHAFKSWQAIEYREEVHVGDFGIRLLDAGHVLGSAMVEIIAPDGKSGEFKKILCSGDIGNPPTPLLKPTEIVKDANIMLVESTYGDRKHEGRGERKLRLERIIEDTVRKAGILMIPAFSLERTQELLFEIHSLVTAGRVPMVPTFLDSPLAIKATDVYRKYESYFNKEAIYAAASGEGLFKFPMLKFTLRTEESKAINDVPAPKIVIAGSGMSTGGRILHHERRYLPDPSSTLLVMGYQAAGSRGRQIQDGAREIEMFGEKIPVRCRVETLEGYSGHPDRDQLVEFVQYSVDALEQVFCIQGEADSALFLVQRIRDYLGIRAHAPKLGASFEI